MTETTGSSTGESIVGAGGGYAPASTGYAQGESVVAARSTVIEIHASQAAGAVLGAADNAIPELPQLALLTMGTQRADFIDAVQTPVLVLSQITAENETTTQLTTLVSGANDMPESYASQIAVLALVRANPDRRRLRAWTFFENGHHFYVLHLGDTGTIVFDTTTRKWSEWQSLNYNNWEANYGINWNEDIIAGSIDSNFLFQIGSAYGTDTGKAITSRITGVMSMRLRGVMTCDEVMVTSSVGMSAVAGETPRMGLRTSDDNGLNWIDWGTLDLSSASPQTQVTWQSLGEIRMPGRVFEITDNGAARRINALDMFSRDEANG